MSQVATHKFQKKCPVCRNEFGTNSRNQKYCDNDACKKFAQKKVGRNRKRRRARNLNRQFHLEWTRTHRKHRDEYLATRKVALCQECGAKALAELKALASGMAIGHKDLTYDGNFIGKKYLEHIEALEKGIVVMKDFEVHHLDGDFRNGADENKAGCCPKCHAKFHADLKKQGKASDEDTTVVEDIDAGSEEEGKGEAKAEAGGQEGLQDS